MRDLHDFTTHREAWRKAITNVLDELVAGVSLDNASISYWEYELAAFDKTMGVVDAELSELKEQVERFKEALKPTMYTKGSYTGEFSFNYTVWIPDEETDETVEMSIPIYVPWDTIKDIMKRIYERAEEEQV